MSTNLISSGTTAREKVNLRTPEVMTAVQEQVESHYRSDIVDKVRRAGGILRCGDPGHTEHGQECYPLLHWEPP